MSNAPSAVTAADRRRAWYSREFLKEFKKPKAGPRFSYHEELREKTAVTIERLIKEGWLERCELFAAIGAKFTSDQLRELLERYGRPAGVSVDKRTLIKRALAVAQPELEAKCGDLVLYQCTTAGLEVIDRFEKEKASAEKAAKERCLEFLKQHNVTAARQEEADFCLAFAPPGANHISFCTDLETVLDCLPPPLRHLSQEDLTAVRGVAALREIWLFAKAEEWLPADLRERLGDAERALTLVRTHSMFRERVARMEPEERVKLQFRPIYQVCDTCRRFDGTVMRLSDVPEFPLEDCSSPEGCVPWLEDGEESTVTTPEEESGMAELRVNSVNAPVPQSSEKGTPPWTREEWRTFLIHCREVLRKLIASEHPDYDQSAEDLQKTILNKAISTHFGWATKFSDQILLQMDEPEPIDYSKFSHFSVSTSLIDTYLYHRAGVGLKQAFWSSPTDQWDGSRSKEFDELVELANAGLMLRGQDIPKRFILACNLVDTLREAIHQVTRKKAPRKNKEEYIEILLQSPTAFAAPALLKGFWPTRDVFPFDEFFFANPAPRGFTEDQTKYLGAAARYHTCMGNKMAPDPLGLYSGGRKPVGEEDRAACCVLCTTEFRHEKTYPFHPGCTCEPAW